VEHVRIKCAPVEVQRSQMLLTVIISCNVQKHCYLPMWLVPWVRAEWNCLWGQRYHLRPRPF